MAPRSRSAAPSYLNVLQADRNQIIGALSAVSLGPDGQWLDDVNPYAIAAQKQIKDDNKVIPTSQIPDFAAYLAAGSFVHCGDAWSYLGRAVDALLRGDVHGAVHLTYYAELRGALSLLSTEGIYVGDFYSCVLDNNGTAVWVSNEGTHRSVWQCLQVWNDSRRASATIGSVLRPGGVDLDSWISAIPGSNLAPVISDLLNRMKFDLQSFESDRARRNTASYNPSRLTAHDLQPEAIRRIVSNIWSTLEPDAKGTFPVLDRLILREILASSFSATHKISDANGEPTEQTDWTTWELWLDALIPTQALSTALYNDLTGVPDEEPAKSFIAAAFGDELEDPEPSEFIEGMLVRAAILLRLTTGSCIKLLKDSGLDSSEIQSWADSLSLVRGLWPASDAPDDRLDLWADTEVALEALLEDQSDDLHGLLRTVAPHLPTLGQTERVVAWSFT